MSKSLGNVLDPFEVIDRFGTDALRYYCLRDVTFGQDGSVSTAAFEARYESELANELGNLASRTIAMLLRYRDGAVPAGPPDPALAADFDGLAERVGAHARPRRADGRRSTPPGAPVRRLNRYVEEQAPWSLAKDPARAEDLDRVLRTLAEGLRVAMVVCWLRGCPRPRAEAARRAGRRRPLARRRAPRRRSARARASAIEPLFPKEAPAAA